MTTFFPQSTQSATEAISMDMSASDCKRQKMMPRSPTCHDTIGRCATASSREFPSIPSLTRLATERLTMLLPSGRPNRRTESFDFGVSAASSRPRSQSGADHYIEHSSFNKQQPPFAAAAAETSTFVAFTSQSHGSTFGTSSSYIGLEGLLPDDDGPEREATLLHENKMIRRSSSIGLDMDANHQENRDLSMESLSHPLAQLPAMARTKRNLDMPVLQS